MHPGPMNRGVEIDPVVADAADALIRPRSVQGSSLGWPSSLVAHPRPGRGSSRCRDPRGRVMLVRRKALPLQSLIVTGARVDPVNGVDAVIDVRIDDGVIAQLGTSLERNGHRVVEGAGLARARVRRPACTWLSRAARTKSIARTAAAAAGGYCAILAMPNTRAGRRLGSGARRALRGRRREAEVRSASSRRSRRARQAAS